MLLSTIYESIADVKIHYYDGEGDVLKKCYQIASEEIYITRDKELLAYATLDGKIIGCVFDSLSRIPDSWYDDENNYDPNTMAYSFDVVVSHKNRDVGAGPKLIQAAMQNFKNLDIGSHVILLLEVVNPKLAKYMMRKYGLRSINYKTGEFNTNDKYHLALQPYLSK